MAVSVIEARSAREFAEFYGLLAEYEGSLPTDLRHPLPPDAQAARAAYAAPNAAFIALAGTEAAGGAGLRALDAGTAVIGRLYVRPAHRRAGAARALVAAVIAFARAHGYQRIVLDTDRAQLKAAYELYVALGFTECPAYGPVGYAAPTFMELRL